MDYVIMPIGKTEINVFYEINPNFFGRAKNCIQIIGAKHNGKAIDLSQKWIDHAQEVVAYFEGVAQIPTPLH